MEGPVLISPADLGSGSTPARPEQPHARCRRAAASRRVGRQPSAAAPRFSSQARPAHRRRIALPAGRAVTSVAVSGVAGPTDIS